MSNPFTLFNEQVRLQLDQFSKDDKSHYLSYMSESIKNIINQRNRTLIIFISVILAQYLYIYDADIDVKISSIHIKEEFWIELLLFIFGWAIAIRLGLIHLKYVTILTVFENSLDAKDKAKDLYLFVVTDNNAIIHYISKIDGSKLSKHIKALHAFAVLIIYVAYSFVYINSQSSVFRQFLHRFENIEKLYYAICAVGLFSLVSLATIGTLIVLQMLSRK